MMILQDLFFGSLWLLGIVFTFSLIYIILKALINGDEFWLLQKMIDEQLWENRHE